MSKKNITEFGLETVEFLADQSMDNGILKDIPIIGWAAKIYSIKTSVQDNLYAAKINKFLLSIDDIPEDKKDEFKANLINDEKETNELCEKVLLALDNITDIKKSDLIACLFIAYLDEKLTNESFRRCVDLTCSVFIDDIIKIVKNGVYMETAESLSHSNMEGLISTPFLITLAESSYELERQGRTDEIGVVHYELSQLGQNYVYAIKHAFRLKNKNL